MKHYALVVLAALLTVGCASLPMPAEEEQLGHFVIPVFTENDSSYSYFSYDYQLKIEKQSDGSTFIKHISLANNRSAHLLTNLEFGEYCVIGYYVVPPKRSNRVYTYNPTMRDYRNCFYVPANKLTVWDTKLTVRKYDVENKPGSTSQSHQFKSMTVEDRPLVESSLERFNNLEQWQPIIF